MSRKGRGSTRAVLKSNLVSEKGKRKFKTRFSCYSFALPRLGRNSILVGEITTSVWKYFASLKNPIFFSSAPLGRRTGSPSQILFCFRSNLAPDLLSVLKGGQRSSEYEKGSATSFFNVYIWKGRRLDASRFKKELGLGKREATIKKSMCVL